MRPPPCTCAPGSPLRSPAQPSAPSQSCACGRAPATARAWGGCAHACVCGGGGGLARRPPSTPRPPPPHLPFPLPPWHPPCLDVCLRRGGQVEPHHQLAAAHVDALLSHCAGWVGGGRGEGGRVGGWSGVDGSGGQADMAHKAGRQAKAGGEKGGVGRKRARGGDEEVEVSAAEAPQDGGLLAEAAPAVARPARACSVCASPSVCVQGACVRGARVRSGAPSSLHTLPPTQRAPVPQPHDGAAAEEGARAGQQPAQG